MLNELNDVCLCLLDSFREAERQGRMSSDIIVLAETWGDCVYLSGCAEDTNDLLRFAALGYQLLSLLPKGVHESDA